MIKVHSEKRPQLDAKELQKAHELFDRLEEISAKPSPWRIYHLRKMIEEPWGSNIRFKGYVKNLYFKSCREGLKEKISEAEHDYNLAELRKLFYKAKRNKVDELKKEISEKYENIVLMICRGLLHTHNLVDTFNEVDCVNDSELIHPKYVGKLFAKIRQRERSNN